MMRNPMLETSILKILNRVETGLREKTLLAETEIAMDRPTVTTDDFTDTLVSLEDRGLVDNRKNLMGDVIWGITDAGKAALKGL